MLEKSKKRDIRVRIKNNAITRNPQRWERPIETQEKQEWIFTSEPTRTEAFNLVIQIY